MDVSNLAMASNVMQPNAIAGDFAVLIVGAPRIRALTRPKQMDFCRRDS
jgi:hypothetical protein